MISTIRTAIVGYGYVGKAARDAVLASQDMELVCVVKSSRTPVPEEIAPMRAATIQEIRKYGEVDVAILAAPTLACPDIAEELLTMGVSTVDSFDVHGEIPGVRRRLDAAAKKHGKVGIVAAGWDPGSDSVLRALFEAMAPRGITYTNFGPGMSMGHTVGAKAVEGVEDALSITIPAGEGAHRRLVYVKLKPGEVFEDVAARIKADPYFVRDETRVVPAESIDALRDVGHGVLLTRKGVSGAAHNQQFSFDMRVNNPALTGQVMASAARAATRQAPGCYTMIEIPPVDLLPGAREENVGRLV